MKLLTTNFVQCAVKSCAKSGKAFPLRFSDCEWTNNAETHEYNPLFVVNIMSKVNWAAIIQVAQDVSICIFNLKRTFSYECLPNKLGLPPIPDEKPDLESMDVNSQAYEDILFELFSLLLGVEIEEGTMTCENCNHQYYIKNKIPNFLLPPHLAN